MALLRIDRAKFQRQPGRRTGSLVEAMEYMLAIELSSFIPHLIFAHIYQ